MIEMKDSESNICQIAAIKNGIYDGKRLISEQWIDKMTAAREVEGTMFRGMSYGFLWWIIHPETGVYAAIGNSGNVIYVNPESNAVVSVTSFFKPSVPDRIDFIENVIMKKL